MCGLVGYLGMFGCKETNQAILKNMLNSIHSRGPDNSDIWINEKENIALGHNRLSIIDLSELGTQPMHSACGRYTIVYNGECYNYPQLKNQLKQQGFRFNGSSDTEVVLAAITHWGLEKALQQFIGMFAFVLWDNKQKCLLLVRDRVGIKPLYYGWAGNVFLFGSELKALEKHPNFSKTISHEALAFYMRYSYIPNPYSIYQNIHKLTPGCILRIDPKKTGVLPNPEPYWSLDSVLTRPAQHQDEQESIEELSKLLDNAVSMRMLSDVPLGCFLSGGIDSSLVTALLQKHSMKPIKTFSIGFSDKRYNEAEQAKLISNYLRTDHTELYLEPRDMLSVIPKLGQLYDEPFADSSQIPTFLVSQLAKQSVTVALSGDGGDELFAGYNRYQWGQKIWQKIRKLPISARLLMGKSLTSIPPHLWDHVPFFNHRLLGNKLHKLGSALSATNEMNFYQQLISAWHNPSKIILSEKKLTADLISFNNAKNLNSFPEKMMYCDLLNYLPDDILTKVDRASMGVSLEVRVPILDHRIIEFAWRQPLSMKIKSGKSKWLLRQLLRRYIPDEIINRPKMGFAIPVGDWLKHDLRSWASSLLDTQLIKQQGYFNPSAIHHLWKRHLSGKYNLEARIWPILMFQLWLNEKK